MGFWTWIRQNLTLKIVSIVAAIMLYVYVQQERNPTINKTLVLTGEYTNKQEGYQVVPDTFTATVVVTGPRPSVDRLKESDIKATADLSGVTSNQPNTPVKVSYQLPKGISDLTLDPARDSIQVQIFRQKTRKIRVEATFANQPPAGFRYGQTTVHPTVVTVRGREDVVNRIDKIIAAASPAEEKGSIDGDFALSAYDSDHNTIEGVQIDPPKVHVTIPFVNQDAEHVVDIQVIKSDHPALPYRISDTITIPNQVTIAGNIDRVNSISRIDTEILSVHDLTSDKTIDASLIIPPDVKVHDLQGHPITRVKVKFVIIKAGPEPPPNPDGAPGSSTTKHDGPITP